MLLSTIVGAASMALLPTRFPRHEDGMVGSLASLSVECGVLTMMRCIVAWWKVGLVAQAANRNALPNTERVDDSEEEAAEYRRHDKRASYFECDCDSVDFCEVERMESHG